MPDHSVIIGCPSTGAKFTPLNHLLTGDELLDKICSGEDIAVSVEEIDSEIEALHAAGCRYYHYHARNFSSREQTTDNGVYALVSRRVQTRRPDMLISFGASRNGSEVLARIGAHGELERVSQGALPLHLGGAHFVTMQAAVELQVVCELERMGRKLTRDYIESDVFRSDITGYAPSERVESVALETNSTARGGNYGASSPGVQFRTYRKVLEWRNALRLLHEVEWVQLARSWAMTRFAVEHPLLGLGSLGQLNVTILFGFSPRLPFPASYEEFRSAVAAAKSLEFDIGGTERRRRVSITVGAAVLPQQAKDHYKPLDIGPHQGERMCALRRLAAYAAQPDSEVDVLRAGMEDTPYEVGADGALMRVRNPRLAEIAAAELIRHGARIETGADAVSDRLGLTLVRDSYNASLQAMAV